MFIYKSLLFLVLSQFGLTQRVAPGVPPQQYQPPPQHHPQQYQQAPIQQQVPIQQQQYQQHVPVQQQQQYQPHDPVPQQQYQHVPVQQQVPIEQHPSHHPHQIAPGQIFSAANIEHEKEHIAEHLSVPIDTSKMSEQELQFHYFKMHDADNNNKLDGCELIKSLIHWHEGDGQENSGKDAQGSLTQTDTELEALVDPILNDVDKDQDGYIDYAEFKRSEQVNTQT